MLKNTYAVKLRPGHREILGTSVLVSLTLLFFFLWFQPGKVQNLEGARWIGVIGGLVFTSFAILFVSQYVLLTTSFKKFRVLTGKSRQEAISIAASLLMLGVGIFLYFYLFGFIRLNPVALMKIEIRILLIGLSPMIVSRRFLAEGSGFSKGSFVNPPGASVPLSHAEPLANSVVSLHSESGREVVRVNVDDLLLVTSADNYIVIIFKGEKGVRKELLRTSLNRVEELLSDHPTIFRCHRTAIVNLRNVKSIRGNSQGYRLKLEQVDRAIPVARSRVRSFRKCCAASGYLGLGVR